jgi:fructose/tagatose bisphosphate aldolase
MSNNTEIGSLVKEMTSGADDKKLQQQIRQLAMAGGIFPASIQTLYGAIGKGIYKGFTVPAMNIRGITYDVARAAFRAALKDKVGPFVFEIARSEIEYTMQSPGEYAACILAAAAAESYSGPVFLQGDHIQFRRKNYLQDPQRELSGIQDLVREAVTAGFYNIDIDASTLVDIEDPDLIVQQETNGLVTAQMTSFIRSIQPEGVTISIGGEIGEIGKGNSTTGDLRAFMTQYHRNLKSGQGISKISVQTGTTHGGVVLPDGTTARVEVDFKTLQELSAVSRAEYGLGGAVQHGASTLPDDMFHLFPEVATLEIHLATGFQNIIFDSPYFPPELTTKIHTGLSAKYANDRKSDDTDAQFYYRNRKRAFGDFKKELWNLPEDTLDKITGELQKRFSLLYHKLNVVNTREIVDKEIKKL